MPAENMTISLTLPSRPPASTVGQDFLVQMIHLLHSCDAFAAILIMTEFSLLREAPALKPPKATAKPYTRHILGIDSGLQSHLKATLRPPHSHTKATPKPTTQAISKAGGRGNRLFSQGLGHNENCWPARAGVASARMPRCISQTDAGRRGESWESHRGVMGYSWERLQPLPEP